MVLLVAACAAAPRAAPAAQEPQRVVRELAFEGNRALDDYTLSAAIATTSSSAWATFLLVRWLGLGEKRYFDEQEFRRDVVRLVLLYRQSGYMNAVIDTLVRRTARDVFVKFRIYEGEPVRVTRLELRGLAGILDTVKLRRELPLQVGDPFNRFQMQASADTIVTRLRNIGYPYADVLRNFDSEAGSLRAEITFEVIPGPRMAVGAVSIEGLRRVNEGTVRRLLAVKPGDLFRQDRLYQSQRDLYGLGVFRYANVVLVDSVPGSRPDGNGGGTDSTVRLLVQVEEGSRHHFRLGAGYGSLECFRVQTGWGVGDFLGGGRVLDVTGRVSKIGGGAPPETNRGQLCNPFAFAFDTTWTLDTLNYTTAVTLRQPTFLSPRHTASLGAFAERRSEFGVYTRDAVGGNVAITFNARRAVPLTLGYGYSVGRTTARAAIYCNVFRLCDDTSQAFLKNRRRFGAVTLTAVRDRVNYPLDPSEGSLVTASLLHASRAVGSDTLYEFNRAELELASYHPLGRRAVFAWRIRGGTILRKKITLEGQGVRFVPPDQRFYAGGANSVRGYGRNELGPRVYTTDKLTIGPTGDTTFSDVETAPTGGNSAFVLNAELRLPSPILPQRVRIGLFVDVGRVWERTRGLVSLDSLRVTPGVGLRFTTPLGPVRVDAAYNGYARQQGPLLFQTADSIVRIRDAYPPVTAPPASFWRRLVLQFAVGQAF